MDYRGFQINRRTIGGECPVLVHAPKPRSDYGVLLYMTGNYIQAMRYVDSIIADGWTKDVVIARHG